MITDTSCFDIHEWQPVLKMLILKIFPQKCFCPFAKFVAIEKGAHSNIRMIYLIVSMTIAVYYYVH